MAVIYRCDVQMRIPWEGGPQEFYYWTNVYYGNLRDLDDFDFWRDACLDVTSRFSNHEVRLDRFLITDVADGSIVQNTASFYPANTALIGEYPALENTVYVKLMASGRQVGFKRYRSPVRLVDIDVDRLTPGALAYYESIAVILGPDANRFSTRDGVLIDDAVVSPLIHCWQLRHGTKRSRYRRLHS